MEYIRWSGATECIFHNKHKTLYNLFSPGPAVWKWAGHGLNGNILPEMLLFKNIKYMYDPRLTRPYRIAAAANVNVGSRLSDKWHSFMSWFACLIPKTITLQANHLTDNTFRSLFPNNVKQCDQIVHL